MTGLSLVTGGMICQLQIKVVVEEPIIIYGKMEGMMQQHYVGEIGKTLILDCGLDVSAATVTEIKVKKPDGIIVTWVASVLVIGGVANYIQYATVVDDFDQPGLYEVQASVTVNGKQLLGKTDRFEVYELFT